MPRLRSTTPRQASRRSRRSCHRRAARLDELTALLAVQTRRLDRLQAEYEKAVAILEARVRSAYIDEPPDMLAFLVSASSFDDVIDNLEFLTRLGRQDRRVAGQVERARSRTAAERRATISTRQQQAATVSVISARTAEARAARDRLAADRDRLTTVESVKESALASNARDARGLPPRGRRARRAERRTRASRSAARRRAPGRPAAVRRPPRASSGRATASS